MQVSSWYQSPSHSITRTFTRKDPFFFLALTSFIHPILLLSPFPLFHISFSVSFLFLITCELFAIFCALSFSYSFFPDSDLLMLGPFQIVSSRIIGDQFHLSSSSTVPGSRSARVLFQCSRESCSTISEEKASEGGTETKKLDWEFDLLFFSLWDFPGVSFRPQTRICFH